MKYIELVGIPKGWNDNLCKKVIDKLGLDIEPLKGLKVKIRPAVDRKTKEVSKTKAWVDISRSNNKPWDPERNGWTGKLKALLGEPYTNGWTGYTELKEEISMVKIGFLNENGDCILCPRKGDIVTVSGEPFIVEEIDGQNLTVIDEEGDYQTSDFELDERVLEITESENTKKEVEGYICLGESEMGEIYVDKGDNCYLLEAKVEMYWPYRSKKGNKAVLTGEKHDDMIEFWDENGKYHEMSVEEFDKQYKKSTAEDLDLFETVTNETAGLEVQKTAVNGKMVTVWINGKKYSYEPTNGMSAKELAAKYDSIAKHSIGKALAWLKKNAVTKDSHKKGD